MVQLSRLFILSFLLWPVVSGADIYRFVDREGVVHYSNTQPDEKFTLYLREAPKAAPRAPVSAIPGASWMTGYVDRFSRANDLPPALVHAIIKAESNGQRKAVSRKGAKGVMQLMPFTSKRLRVADPFDPIENIEGGIKYIKELLVTFQGDLTNTVAAYNAGPAAVRKYGGVPPYQETRLYVRRVLDLYRQYSAVE
ncbi:MAG: transglycosylase SLT domain-containing protein [Deltaproteobacteria bacterium]|uniref:transglycosylase SLT domain-containing protein n=1 Tax=Candidatus Deferrimicrobium sp. TaxID=3060586 RepID=UPI00271F4725|nr:transglycosylase SLT domain-containing protein [Candidatus Deferrimicrobium sp.]MCR4308582.1 transglycosylase SLT domain-containing protein [Deltaproteobacteria bacterium]MDO8738637.1 transglycosylase SLT domain-containing protein [Candidatus Deferrimicrobium sp.]